MVSILDTKIGDPMKNTGLVIFKTLSAFLLLMIGLAIIGLIATGLYFTIIYW